jgi:hypothetical protein
MMLIIEASVVVLPEPVGPVTSTNPRGCKAAPTKGEADLFHREQLARDLEDT